MNLNQLSILEEYIAKILGKELQEHQKKGVPMVWTVFQKMILTWFILIFLFFIFSNTNG